MLDFATPMEFARSGHCDQKAYAGALKQANLADDMPMTKQIAPHEHLFHEFDAATHFYEVLTGTFCVYKLLPDGRRYIVSFAMAGDLVGFGAEDVHMLSAQAIDHCTVRPVEFSSLEQIVASYPGLATKLLHNTRQELADAQNQLVTVARKSAIEKLATFLVTLSKRNRARGGKESVVQLPMTRCDIADFLGLTLETVSRTLSKLKRAGIIDLPQSSQVVIRDKTRLELLAEV